MLVNIIIPVDYLVKVELDNSFRPTVGEGAVYKGALENEDDFDGGARISNYIVYNSSTGSSITGINNVRWGARYKCRIGYSNFYFSGICVIKLYSKKGIVENQNYNNTNGYPYYLHAGFNLNPSYRNYSYIGFNHNITYPK